MAALADCGRPDLAVTMTDESFRLHVLPAGNGDALVLEYGPPTCGSTVTGTCPSHLSKRWAQWLARSSPC